MPDAITELLERQDGSAGRVKADLRPSPNRVHYWPADELNKVLDWCVAASKALGLSDGSTPGSILRKLRDVGSRDAPVVFEDFIAPSIGTAAPAQHISLVTGGSSVDVSGWENAPGLLIISASSGGFYGVVRAAHNAINTHSAPVFRARIRTPSAFMQSAGSIGFGSWGGGTSMLTYARFAWLNSGDLLAETASDDLGGSASASTGVTLAPSTFYDLEVRYAAESVDYYVNGVLVHTETTPNTSSDYEPVAAFQAHVETTGAGGSRALMIDYYSIAPQQVTR